MATFNELVKKQRENNLNKSSIDVGQLRSKLDNMSSECFDIFVDTTRDMPDFANIMQDMMGLIERAEMILFRMSCGNNGGEVL